LTGYYIFQASYYIATAIVVVPVYYALLAAAHVGFLAVAIGAVGLAIIAVGAIAFIAGAIVLSPVLVTIGPLGAGVGIIAGGLAFMIVALVAAIPVFGTVLSLYIGKWIWVGSRDYIFIPIFDPEQSNSVSRPASGTTGAFTAEEDAAAVVDAVNCEYEPDDPSCEDNDSRPTAPPPSVAPPPPAPAEVEVDQFGNEITDEYELIDVNAGNPGIFYKLDDFFTNLDFDPTHLLSQVFPDGIHIGQLSLDF